MSEFWICLNCNNYSSHNINNILTPNDLRIRPNWYLSDFLGNCTPDPSAMDGKKDSSPWDILLKRGEGYLLLVLMALFICTENNLHMDSCAIFGFVSFIFSFAADIVYRIDYRISIMPWMHFIDLCDIRDITHPAWNLLMMQLTLTFFLGLTYINLGK